MPDWLQNLISTLILGLSTGAIYALIAVGYTMVYGVLRLINFAHGDVYMVGAMTAYFVGTSKFDALAWPWLASPLLWGPVLGVVLVGMHARGVRGWGREVVVALVVAAGALIFGGLMSKLIGGMDQPGWWRVVFALLAAMAICGALGMLIELLAYRPLRASPRINSLITAIGVSMLLMYGGQAVFGATPKPFPVPKVDNPFLFQIGSVGLGKIDALIIGVTLVLMLALRHIVLHTRTGLALRAVSHRFDTASLMGVNIDRIVSFTFVLGSVLAAAAGVLIACQYPSVSPLMGLMMGLKAFVAAVLGGIGNIAGAVLGAVLLGTVEVMVVTYVDGGSQWKDGVAFVILIAVLLLKPSGLLGGKAIEKV